MSRRRLGRRAWERELVAVLGAGLTAVSTGFGVAVDVGAIDRGYSLVDILSRESGPRIGANLNAMVQALWLSWSQCGLERDVVARHAEALPAIIELNRPAREVFTAALAHQEGSGMLAADIITRARQSQDLARAGLDETAAFDLLERTFRAILADRTALSETIAAVDLYLQSGLWRQQAVEPPSPVSAEPRSATPGNYVLDRLPPSAVSAIAMIAATNANRLADPDKAAIESHDALIVLIANLGGLVERARDVSVPLLAASRRLLQGEFADADRSLIAALEVLIARATSDLAIARQMMLWSVEVHDARGRLDLIRFDYRKAARHFRAALRCLTRNDPLLMWEFLNKQAKALVSHDQQHEDTHALVEATDALNQALGLSPAPVDTPALGEARFRLAIIWMRRAERSRKAADFIETALVAGDAATAFSDASNSERLIRVKMMEAEAYWQAGNSAADQAALEASARSFQNAQNRIERGGSPALWIEATSMLGQVLLRMATSREEPKILPAAIEQLRAASQFAAGCGIDGLDMVPTETALGRALLAEYASGGQALLLDLAATAFRRAIRMTKAAKDLGKTAALQHELGMTQWAIADLAGDMNAVALAEETLETSIANFRTLQEAESQTAVENDLAQLRRSGLKSNSSSVASP